MSARAIVWEELGGSERCKLLGGDGQPIEMRGRGWSSGKIHVVTRARSSRPWRKEGFGPLMYSWRTSDAGQGPFSTAQEAAVRAQEYEIAHAREREHAAAWARKRPRDEPRGASRFVREVRELLEAFLASSGMDADELHENVRDLAEDGAFVSARNAAFHLEQAPRAFVAEWFCVSESEVPELAAPKKRERLHRPPPPTLAARAVSPVAGMTIRGIPPNATIRQQMIRGSGPYWYAAWKENGRTRTKYVGRELPPEFEARAKRSRSIAIDRDQSSTRANPADLARETAGTAPALSIACADCGQVGTHRRKCPQLRQVAMFG